jgi:arsenite methyltransferase
MANIEVFDPPLCCPTGVCGPTVDPVLARFAADLEWLRAAGVQVERYNPLQQPERFAASQPVLQAMGLAGERCLPVILVDGVLSSQGRYPDRRELARLAGLEAAG